MAIYKGHTFAATELVTSTKLNSLVDSASIALTVGELSTGFLSSLATTAGLIRTYNLALGSLTTLSGFISPYNLALGSLTTISGYINPYNLALGSLTTVSGILNPINIFSFTNVATNMSVPNVSGKSHLKLHWSTYGSIASLTGMVTGQQFTLIAGQASFPAILDGGAFALSANWIADGANDNLTLVWDGTNFIETGRVNT